MVYKYSEIHENSYKLEKHFRKKYRKILIRNSVIQLVCDGISSINNESSFCSRFFSRDS